MNNLITRHIISWILTCVLFLIIYFVPINAEMKKIVKIVLRTTYVLVLASGTELLFSLTNINMLYVIKSIMGIAVIGLAEMLLARRERGKSSLIVLAIFVFVFLLTVYLGLTMPIGVYLLHALM